MSPSMSPALAPLPLWAALDCAPFEPHSLRVVQAL